MRAESYVIAKAFLARRKYKRARTYTDGDAVYLHGNRIAWWDERGDLNLTLAGWGTATTRERLNTICMLLMDQRPFHQKKHTQFFNDNEIDTRQIITIHQLTITPMDEWLAAAE